uniref:Uncharacterized protein n=1 Tax=Bracon brevicornis TaxID=1563983 RepID=A0A6V7JQ45_9HYME
MGASGEGGKRWRSDLLRVTGYSPRIFAWIFHGSWRKKEKEEKCAGTAYTDLWYPNWFYLQNGYISG